MAVMVILFWVNVPVLSVIIVSATAKVSVADKRRTMAFLVAILFALRANTTVRTTGRPSGNADIKEATENIKISSKRKSLKKKPTRTIKAAEATAIVAICLLSSLVFTLKWSSSVSTELMSL